MSYLKFFPYSNDKNMKMLQNAQENNQELPLRELLSLLEGVPDQSKRLAGASRYIRDIHQQLAEHLLKEDANFDQQIWVDKREVKSGSSLFLRGK